MEDNILDKIDIILNEKWKTKMNTPEDKKGMWKGWTLEDLKKERKRLKDLSKRTTAESTRLREVNFALRAKTGFKEVPK